MEDAMKLLALCLCLFACGTAEEEIAEPTPAAPVSSMRSVQTAFKPAPMPKPEPKPVVTRHRLEVPVSRDAWTLRGTGKLDGDELRTVPSMATCQEFVSGYSASPAAYAWDLATRLETTVQLPAEALAAADLTVAPVVEYASVGTEAHFVRAADNFHCYEQPYGVAEWRAEATGSSWRPTYREYIGESAGVDGATAIRLRLRLHGNSTATLRTARVLVLWSTVTYE